MGSPVAICVGLTEILDLLPLLDDCGEGELADELTDHACDYLALLGVQINDNEGSSSLPDSDVLAAVLLRAADVLRQAGEQLLLAELRDAGDRCVRMAAALGVASATGLGRRVRVEAGLDGIPVLVVGGHHG